MFNQYCFRDRRIKIVSGLIVMLALIIQIVGWVFITQQYIYKTFGSPCIYYLTGSYKCNYEASSSSSSSSSSTNPYSTSTYPYSTYPYSTYPYSTYPYSTYPYSTYPYSTYPYSTYPYSTNPYSTNPYSTNTYSTNTYSSTSTSSSSSSNKNNSNNDNNYLCVNSEDACTRATKISILFIAGVVYPLIYLLYMGLFTGCFYCSSSKKYNCMRCAQIFWIICYFVCMILFFQNATEVKTLKTTYSNVNHELESASIGLGVICMLVIFLLFGLNYDLHQHIKEQTKVAQEPIIVLQNQQPTIMQSSNYQQAPQVLYNGPQFISQQSSIIMPKTQSQPIFGQQPQQQFQGQQQFYGQQPMFVQQLQGQPMYVQQQQGYGQQFIQQPQGQTIFLQQGYGQQQPIIIQQPQDQFAQGQPIQVQQVQPVQPVQQGQPIQGDGIQQ